MKQKFLMSFVGLVTLCGCIGNERHYVNISEIQELSNLNVLYVTVAERLKLSSSSGKTWTKFLVRVGAFYSLNLKSIHCDKAMVEKGESLVMKLDAPEIYPCADMRKCKEYDQHTAPFVTDKSLERLRAKFPDEANKLIAKAAINDEYMKMAKEQSESVLKSMLPGVKLKIEWRE